MAPISASGHCHWPKLWLLVAEGVIALYIGDHYFHLDLVHLQTFTVLMLIFTSQFRVYIVRERGYFWSSLPGRELLIATGAALIVCSLLGIYGVFISSLKGNGNGYGPGDMMGRW